ncbi:alpha-amylase, partial [Escherichia coli]|nr:alpha-amylase [Escherichia coli]
MTIAVGDSFPEGTKLRDAYSGQMVEVTEQKVSLTPSQDSGGLVLLEPVQKTKAAVPFDYRNANIYFVMVDRFNNADASNDNSYGRKKDGKDEVGT